MERENTHLRGKSSLRTLQEEEKKENTQKRSFPTPQKIRNRIPLKAQPWCRSPYGRKEKDPIPQQRER